MNTQIKDNFKSGLLLTVVIILIRMIGFLPWWLFVIPVIILGSLLAFMEWNIRHFIVGFITGFLIWFFAALYYDILFNGIILNRIAALVFFPKIFLFITTGLIGGVLTGTAFYLGKTIIKSDHISDLQD